MGEKPMGAPADDEELGPDAGAAGINTTRDNIPRRPRPASAGVGGAEPDVDEGEPDEPGGDASEPPAGSISTTRSNIKSAAGSGQAAGAASDPIPGVDVIVKKDPR